MKKLRNLNFLGVHHEPVDKYKGDLTDSERESYHELRKKIEFIGDHKDTYETRYQAYYSIFEWSDKRAEPIIDAIMNFNSPLPRSSRYYYQPEGALQDTNVIIITLTETRLYIRRLTNGRLTAQKSLRLSQHIDLNRSINAMDLGDLIGTNMKQMASTSPMAKPHNVVFTTTLPLDDLGCALTSIINIGTDAYSDDPIVGIEIQEFLDSAFLNSGISNRCAGIINSECAALCASFAIDSSLNSFMSIVHGNTLSIGIAKLVDCENLIYRLDLSTVNRATSRNVIDSVYDFENRNGLDSATIDICSGHAVAELLRLTMLHIMRDRAPIECYFPGAIKAEDVYLTLMEHDPDDIFALISKIVERRFPSVDKTKDPLQFRELHEIFDSFSHLILSRAIFIISTIIVAVAGRMNLGTATVLYTLLLDESYIVAEYDYEVDDLRDRIINAIQCAVDESTSNMNITIIENPLNIELGAASYITNPAVFDAENASVRSKTLAYRRHFTKNVSTEGLPSFNETPIYRNNLYFTEIDPKTFMRFTEPASSYRSTSQDPWEHS